MKCPRITIGILNRDGEEFLKKVIPNLLKLKYPNYEILVVDNYSKDRSIDYLKKISSKIRIIRNSENKGYGYGKNQIVKNSKGEYVLMLDNDIQINDKDFLKKIYNFYRGNKKLSFLSVPLIDDGFNLTEHYGLFFTSRKKKIDFTKILKKKSYSSGGFIGGLVFFKKIDFEELNYFDEKYPFNLDDYDLSARSWLKAMEIKIYTKTSATHLGVNNRINVNSFCWKNKYYLCGFSRMILKNYRLNKVIIWLPLAQSWIFYKSIKACFKLKSFKPLLSYFSSYYLFLRDFSDTLEKRKIIQSKRVVKEDIFLKIKPPKF